MGAKGRPARNLTPLRLPGGRRRHCWVLLGETASTPCAGLVLEWSRTPAGDWQARVVYVPEGAAPASVEAWVNARFLRPVPPD